MSVDRRLLLLAGTLAGMAAMAAQAQTTVRVQARDCAALVVHRPAPGVAFKPGVDAHGDRVTPADLAGSRFDFDMPETVEFDISFNPLEDGAARRFPRSELIIGLLEYDLNTGAATLNGHPLSGPELSELARKCRRGLGGDR